MKINFTFIADLKKCIFQKISGSCKIPFTKIHQLHLCQQFFFHIIITTPCLSCAHAQCRNPQKVCTLKKTIVLCQSISPYEFIDVLIKWCYLNFVCCLVLRSSVQSVVASWTSTWKETDLNLLEHLKIVIDIFTIWKAPGSKPLNLE